jgi:hypothetical protein
MKSQILKLIVIIALSAAGCFASLAQNNGSTLSSANHPVSSSTTFAIDKNIISVEISNLIDSHILEYAPYPNYGGSPEAWSPHFWTITLIMAAGTDVTSLAPIITLAPGATITSKHARVQDFSQQVEYTVICEDGSTVTYLFLAYVQNNTRAMGGLVDIFCFPSQGGATSPSGTLSHDGISPFYCVAFAYPDFSFDRWAVNGSTAGTSSNFGGYIPLINNVGILTAIFKFKSPVFYTVTVQSENTSKGIVSGGGMVVPGSIAHVFALPNSGWQFEGWYLNGSKISGLANFSFIPSSNCTLIAKFTPTPTLTGPALVCTFSNSVYTLNNLPANATVSWSSGNRLNITPGPANNQVTVSAANYSFGSSWIQANINGTTITKNIIASYPDPYNDLGSIALEAEYDHLIGVPAWPTEYGINSYVWDWAVPCTGGVFSGWYEYVSVYFWEYNTNYTLYAYAINHCGTSPEATYVQNIYVTPPAWMYLSSIYPNPASNILNIEIGAQAQSAAPAITADTQLKQDKTFDLRLYDGQGNLLHNAKAKGGTVQFNVASLPNGIYYLHIYDGASQKPEIRQIVVEH